MNPRGKATGNHCSTGRAATWAFIFALFLHAAWIGAWLLEQHLEPRTDFLATSGGRSLYWLLMKVVLWVLPSIALMRKANLRMRKLLGCKRMKATLIWGLGAGMLLGAMALLSKLAGDRPLFHASLGWHLFSGVITAPLIEEFTFRGAILGVLKQRFHFWTANITTALFFLGIHLPGWYFQGHLFENLSNPVGGALSVFLLGLVFGYVTHKSDSVTSGALAHMLNNFINL